jgi:ADP-ribose pyrophosphatase
MDAHNAVERYQDLCRRYPSILQRDPDFAYRIVADPASMIAFAKAHGVLLGVHSETPYTFFVVDLVEKDDPSGGPPLRFPYQRLLLRRQLEGHPGVVVVPINANAELGEVGGIFLVTQSRHATGATHLELVRGFGEPGLSAQDNASKELREEAGLLAARCVPIGTIFPDTGLSHAEVTVVAAYVEGRIASEPEAREATGPILLLSERDLCQAIGDGLIQDAMSIAAITRYLWGVRSSQFLASAEA